MKKNLKKIISLVLTFVLLSIMSIQIFAESIDYQNVKTDSESISEINSIKIPKESFNGEQITLPDGAILTPITQSEYIYMLAEEYDISIEEATKIENANKNIRATSVIEYVKFSKDFVFPENKNFSSTLNAVIKIQKWQGGAVQIENIDLISTKAKAGQYNYRWEELAVGSDPSTDSSKFPTTSVVILGSGYYEITTNTTVGISGGVPGFEANTTADNLKYYTSDTHFLEYKFSVY